MKTDLLDFRSSSAGESSTPRTPDSEIDTGRQKHDRTSWLVRWLTGRLLAMMGHPQLGVRLPNGELIRPQSAVKPDIDEVRFMDWRALAWVLADPLYQFGELFVDGRVQFHGPPERILSTLVEAMLRDGQPPSLTARMLGWLHLPRGTSLRAARRNIHHHYDLGNDFYAMWLDKHLAYTCAYFPRQEMTLEEAQLAKFDHVCRKVQLRPGMRVIEAGCGWGGLALHMARSYGVRVTAYNISAEQVRFARQRAHDEGLDHSVEFLEQDWRAIEGRCDAFVSVGMLEHVGRRHYRLLGRVIDRCLAPHGRGLIHTIGQNAPGPFNPWMERRIFPGAYPPALSELLAILEPNGFSVLDVENLRLHYARTLQQWLDRFRAAEPIVRRQLDDRFIRMWQFYLAGCLAAFATGGHQLFQVVFARATENGIPMTRAHQYVDPQAEAIPARPNPFGE